MMGLFDPVTNIQEAKRYVTLLADVELDYHFDDNALDCLHDRVGHLMAIEIGVRVDELRKLDLDWGEHGCAIGYMVYILDQMGAEELKRIELGE